MRRDTYKFTDFINYNFSGLFRFRSPEDLQRLYEGLQLPGRPRLRTYETKDLQDYRPGDFDGVIS